MRSFFSLVLVVLLFAQCKKMGDGGPSEAYNSRGPSGPAGDIGSTCPNCGSVRFNIALNYKNAGGNYVIVNNITSKDIEVRNSLNQLISSSNVSVTFPEDLKGVIIFPMPDQARFFLKIRTNLLLEVSYTSKVNYAGQYEISGVKVKDRTSTAEKITGGYLLKIDI